MGKMIVKKINAMGMWSKIGMVCMLVAGILIYQMAFQPKFLNSATNTYYFKLDTAAVNLGADGSTTTTATLGGKISMATGVYATSRRVSSSASTSAVTMLNVYGPAYTADKTVTSPSLTIGVQERLTVGNINWQAKVYDYNPAGVAGNGVLLWTSDLIESHPSVQTPLALTFSDKSAKMVANGHRLKVVITAQAANSASQARLFWGNSTNYSSLSVSEANYVANSVTVDNLADSNAGSLTAVLNSESNISMLQFDMYSNAASATWSGGMLDKLGTNSDTGSQVQFSIYKDTNGNGVFDPGTDTKIGGPYTFSSANGQAYTLSAAQNLTTTPQRYFVAYDLSGATPSTTIGARIAGSSYFTVSGAAGGVNNVTSTSSSIPTISSGGSTTTKTYAADWDTGHTLTLSTSPATSVTTNTTCITRTTSMSSSLIGFLNYPGHSCASVSGQFYTSTVANSNFVNLYMSKPSGYNTDLTTLTGVSFTHRIYTPKTGGTFTYTLFFVDPSGVYHYAATPAKYAVASGTAATSQVITVSLGGQTFTGSPGVPKGSHVGIRIGVSAASMGVGLGGSVSAGLTVQETAAVNNNVDVGNGSTIANSSANASATDVPVDSFTLSATTGQNVTGITVTGNAIFNSTNVKKVKIYLDGGAVPGVLDPGDTLVGTADGSTISGNSVTVTLSTPQAVSLAAKRYILAYDISDTPNVNVVVTGLVSDLVASVGGLGNNSDANGASVNILPTTTIGDVTESGTPVYVLPGGAASIVDGFTVSTNGGASDTIRTLIVTLGTSSTISSTKYIHISDYVAKVEIVDAAGSVVYGSLTAPTAADDWQVPITTAAMTATSSPVGYAVRITPKANQSITYDVTAQITGIAHSKTSYGLSLNDLTSSMVIIDGQPPTNVGLFKGATDPGNAGGKVDLWWSSDAGDPSPPGTSLTGSGLLTYRVLRGAGNAPAPTSCSSGTNIYQGTGIYTSSSPLVDSGLTPGQTYGYRLCVVDNAGNTSLGTKTVSVASMPTSCNNAPALFINPTSQFVKAGGQSRLRVAYTNNDTGNCASVPFTLSTSGVDTNNFTVAFDSYTGMLSANSGSKSTYLTVTPKPGIAQNTVASFNVTVNGGGAYITTSPTPVTITVNNAGPMIHSSQQLGTLKYGSWGLGYNCNTCHYPVGGNIKQLRSSIDTPNGNRPVVFTTTSAAQSVTTGVFGNDFRSGTTSTNVCEVCHHNTRYHQYSTSKLSVLTHNPSRDCMQCHQHNNGFKASGAAGCSDCHGYPPTSIATLASPPTYALKAYSATNFGKHATHNTMGLTCYVCHNNANHARDIVNNTPDSHINMQFQIDGTTFPGFNGNVATGTFTGSGLGNGYGWQGGTGTNLSVLPYTVTCNVYCHNINYNNQSYEINSNGYNNIPSWMGNNQVGCGSCHATNGADAYFNTGIALGSHQKHASTLPGGNAIPCMKCHGYRNYSSNASHINGSVELDLSAISPIATYKASNKYASGAPAPSGSYGSCNNLYCHSNVQNNQPTPGASTVVGTRFGQPTWGTSVTCGNCHDYPNTTGGHPQHVGYTSSKASNVITFDCRICHANGGDANSFNHANGQINFQFAGLGVNTNYSYGASKIPGSGPYGTCNNSNCHGRATKTWGPASSTPLCEKCHGSASTAGFYNSYGPPGSPNSTTSNTDSHVGAHFRHLTSSSINNPNVKYSASIDCSACHVKPDSPYTPGHIDQGHVNNGQPATLTFGTVAQSGVQNGYTTLPVYSGGQCSNVWCHGAGMNSNAGTGPYQSVGPAGQTGPLGQIYDGGSLGSPLVPTWSQPFITGVAGASGPASPSGGDCTKCHSYPPPAPLPGYRHYGLTPGAVCQTCHPHLNAAANGFTDASKHVNGQIDSCYNCHGKPPVDETTLVNPPVNALNPGMIGAHNKHADNPAIGLNCSVCHNSFSPTSMQTGNLLIGFNAYGGQMQSGTFTGFSTLTNDIFVSGSAGTTVRRTENSANVNVCSNIYCHGGGTVAPSSLVVPALGGGAHTTPHWENGSAEAVCGNCHGTTFATYSSRGSHRRHIGTGPERPGLNCQDCHGPHNDNTHVNGAVQWNFYSTVRRMNGANGYGAAGYQPSGFAFYNASGSTGTLAPSSAYGTCNVYCHSDARGTFTTTPVWGAPFGSLTCSGCHKNMSSDPAATGSHVRHAQTQAYSCGICHGSGYAAVAVTAATHVNGYLNISGNAAASGLSYSKGKVITVNTAYGSCSNLYCHSNVQTYKFRGTTTAAASRFATPTWGATGSVTCGSCHPNQGQYSTAGTGRSTGSHNKHANIQGFACSTCHSGAGSGTPYHANKTIDISFSGNGAGAIYSKGSHAPGAGANGNCSSVKCHGNGAGSTGTTPVWGSGPLPNIGTCTSCHGTKSTTNGTPTTLSGKHDNHMNSGTYSSRLGLGNGFNCVNCHARTISSFSNHTLIAPRVNHNNGFVDFTSNRGGKLAPFTYTGAPNATLCNNIYCHSNGNPQAPVYVSMTGSKTWTGSATIACNGCHGRSNSNKGAPDYASGGALSATANSHTRHVGPNGLNLQDTRGCAYCHVKTVDSGTANKLLNYSTQHLNGTRNVNFKLFGGKTGSWNAGATTCSATYCHGTTPGNSSGITPVWGMTSNTPLGCNSCHSAQSADATWAGRHSTHYAATALSSSYSNMSGNKSSATVYRFTCGSCHSSAKGAVHRNGPANGNGVAQVFFGYTNATRKGSYVYGTTQGTTDNGFAWSNGNGCDTTYCHSNGNGGAPNTTAITWASPAGTLSSLNCTGCHGNDVASGTVMNSNKHRNHLDPSYNVSLGLGNGYGCVSCHFKTVSDNRTIKDKSKHVNKFKDFSSNRGGSTYSNYICANIYCHSNGNPAAQVFVAMTTTKAWNSSATLNCNGCHGRSNASTGAPDYANGGLGSNTPNNHAKHVTNLGITDTTKCSICHYKTASKSVAGRYKDYTAATYHINNKRDVIFDATRAGLFGSAATWTPSGNAGTCSNVYCHSNVQSSNGTAGPSSYGSPTWGDNFAGACNKCHLDQKTDATGTGNHLAHANMNNAGYACSTCHSGAGDGTANHANGTIDISFSGTAVGAVYSKGSHAPGSGPFGTCSTNPCHGGNSATWGSATGTLKCLNCHTASIGNRAAISTAFSGNSHHVQGVTLDSSHCYQCHWEANSDGTINYSYHAKGGSGAAVQLVIYGSGVRPTTRTPNVTYVAYTANGAASRRRTEVKKINLVCRGCHRSANDTAQPFGDGKTPKQYSWDGYSIFSRYSSGYSNTGNDVTAWGKYNVNNTNTKATANKAYSAHGNAKNNMRGWDTTNGTDSPTYSAPATDNVYCFDCHNSHGTAATGVMSSYSSATGRYRGAILKSTVNGKGGFSATYTPAQAGSTGTHDLTNPGADLCFDCHSNQTSNSSYPWGYNDTFGIPAGKSVFGYWDSTRFTGSGAGTFPPATRYGYKAGTSNAKNANMGGHLGASSALTTTVSQRTFPSGMKDVIPPSGSVIQGLCTPCHDPHGVSPSLGASKQYGVPLLKGTWITSPYQEDAAPTTPAANRGGSTNSSSGQQGPLVAGGTPGYHIDQNTLGATTNATSAPRATSYPALSGAGTLQTQTSANFAGLCTGCHNQSAIANSTSTAATAANWKTVGRIHQSVKGWAATTGTGGNVNNAKHAYLCSKCHTPHNYRLPRLLVTNCLDAKHLGRVSSGGNPGQTTGSGSSGQGLGRFPGGGGGSTSGNASSAWGPGAWFFGTAGSGGAAGSTQTCHDSPNAGGTFNGYTTEKWNNKSQW